jgi:hypothetical protein
MTAAYFKRLTGAAFLPSTGAWTDGGVSGTIVLACDVRTTKGRTTAGPRVLDLASAGAPTSRSTRGWGEGPCGASR